MNNRKKANKPDKTCIKAEILMDKKLENKELTLTEETFLAVHLLSCAGCRAYEQEGQSIANTLNSLDNFDPVPAGLVDKIMEQLPPENRKPVIKMRLVSATIAASILMLFMSFSVMSHLDK